LIYKIYKNFLLSGKQSNTSIIELYAISSKNDIKESSLYWVNNSISFTSILTIFYTPDEECLRPGEASDETFLEKLELNVGTHPHFCAHNIADNKTKKVIERNVSLY
jgi:hypothetical protein